MRSARRNPSITSLVAFGVIVLVVVYVLSFGLMEWGYGKGCISYETAAVLERGVYRPLRWYMSKELPGWQILFRYYTWCLERGFEGRDWDANPAA